MPCVNIFHVRISTLCFGKILHILHVTVISPLADTIELEFEQQVSHMHCAPKKHAQVCLVNLYSLINCILCLALPRSSSYRNFSSATACATACVERCSFAGNRWVSRITDTWGETVRDQL